MSVDKVFIDSNIFLYAFSQQDANKHEVAKQWIIKENTTISVQVINEVSNNLLKRFSFKETQLKQFINSAYTRYAVIDLSESIFTNATSLRLDYQFSYYDSIIVASALEAECSIICTEDMQHNQLINDSLRITNPFDN